MIEKIQAEVVMKRLRIREFFKDFDPLRKGTITEQQFRRVLHISNLNISESDISVLLAQYKIDQLPNGLVRFSEFCEEVDKIFTTKGIDKDPQAVVAQIQKETTLPARRRYLVEILVINIHRREGEFFSSYKLCWKKKNLILYLKISFWINNTCYFRICQRMRGENSNKY